MKPQKIKVTIETQIHGLSHNSTIRYVAKDKQFYIVLAYLVSNKILFNDMRTETYLRGCFFASDIDELDGLTFSPNCRQHVSVEFEEY